MLPTGGYHTQAKVNGETGHQSDAQAPTYLDARLGIRGGGGAIVLDTKVSGSPVVLHDIALCRLK